MNQQAAAPTAAAAPSASSPFAGSLVEFRRGWKVVVAAASGVGAGITGVHMYSLSLFLVPLTLAFGWTRTEVSAAKTFVTIGLIATAPLAGIVADKVGVRKMGLVSLFLFAAGCVGMTQITANVWTYYAGLVMLAALGGCTTALIWTRGVAGWFVEKRGLALAFTLSGTGVAGVIAPPVIGGLIDTYGWQAGYLGIGGLALLAMIPVYFFFHEGSSAKAADKAPAAAAAEEGMTLREAARTRRFWQAGLAFFFIAGIVSSLTVHLVPLITDSGLTREAALGVAGVLGVAVIVGRLLTGYLVDRFHPPLIAAIFVGLPVVGMTLFLLGSGSTALIVLAVICVGFAAGSEIDLLPYLTAQYFGLKHYGKIYGWQFVMFYSGVGLGPLSFGWSYDQFGSYQMALMTAAPVLALAAILLGLLGRAPAGWSGKH